MTEDQTMPLDSEARAPDVAAGSAAELTDAELQAATGGVTVMHMAATGLGLMSTLQQSIGQVQSGMHAALTNGPNTGGG